MDHLESMIREKFSDLKTPKEFAQEINDLGYELMESGQLDSDELLWEVARDLWQDFDPDFEDQVSDEFDKLLEDE